MIGHPKPTPPVKQPNPLRRKAPMPRQAPKVTRRRRLKFANAYTRPEWRALVRQVRKRSKGICEARVQCSGNPVEGDPHHLAYLDLAGWRRLLVPLDQLVDCCRPCHLEFERRKSEGVQPETFAGGE